MPVVGPDCNADFSVPEDECRTPTAEWNAAIDCLCPGRVVESLRMVGTLINATAILIGGVVGLTAKKPLSPVHQTALKVLLGAYTVYAGLSASWQGLNGNPGQILKQLGTILLALMLGNLTGKLLRIQKSLNHLGQFAKGRITRATPANSRRFSEGFLTCSILFCLTPVGIIGSLQDGLSGNFKPLAIKAVMDGLATMALVTSFGWSALLSIVPVVAGQGTLTLLAHWAQPWLHKNALVDPLDATAGLLVFCVALIILDLKKIELADYLPSLVFAPLLAWLWR